MVEIVSVDERLHLQFEYSGIACLEDTGLTATPANRRFAEQTAAAIGNRIDAGTFSYKDTFPNSQIARMLALLDPQARAAAGYPLFKEYAEQWFAERRIEWRRSYADTIRLTLDKYLIPAFGDQRIDAIDKNAILAFRISLADRPGLASGSSLSASRINKVMLPLRMIIIDAADRLGFECHWRLIKSIREPRGRVDPLSLPQIERFLDCVRPDFRAYFEIRFFTGTRSSEINGLRWRDVDLEGRAIHVEQALVRGKLIMCKNDASNRIIQLSQRVVDVMNSLAHRPSAFSDLVFVGKRGRPLNNAWVTNFIWYPALGAAGLAPRRPYQTRHTAATLWLAAGENPQWIARQLGHTTTEMLFRIYARYVPNAICRDGDALEAYLNRYRRTRRPRG